MMLQSLSSFAISTLKTGAFPFKKCESNVFWFTFFIRKVNGNVNNLTKHPLIRIQICTLACLLLDAADTHHSIVKKVLTSQTYKPCDPAVTVLLLLERKNCFATHEVF